MKNNFLLLTDPADNKRKHLVKIDNIVHAAKAKEHTKVYLKSPITAVEVKESPEEILRLIKKNQ